MMTVTAHARPLPFADASVGDTFLPFVLVLVGVAVLIGLVSMARKRMFGGQGGAEGDGLSLGGLRDLVRRGKMTQAEFDQAKAQIVAAAQRKAERDALEVKPLAPPRPRGRADSGSDDLTL